MKYRCIWLFYCLLCCCTLPAGAQVTNQYHLDLYNDLPSNLTYNILLDNFGYLWICTDKALARYNGYAIKKYTTENGLPTNDVWGLKRDQKNRLWLYSNSNRLGYISNGRYRDAHVLGKSGSFEVTYISEYEHGICLFNSRPDTPGGSNRMLYIERNDTILPLRRYFVNYQLGRRNTMALVSRNFAGMYRINSDGSLKQLGLCAFPDKISSQATGTGIFYKNVVYYVRYTNKMYIIDVKNCAAKTVALHDASGRPDPISMFTGDDPFHPILITRQNLYIMDSGMNIIRQYPVHTLISDTAKTNGSRISGFIDDPFWYKCVATQNAGVYINYGTEPYFNKILDADLSDYIWIGNTAKDTASYWWSYKSRTLLVANATGSIERQAHNHIYDAVKMIPYAHDTSLLAEKGGPYFYNHSRHNATVQVAACYRVTNRAFDDERQTSTIYTRDISVAGPGHFYIAGAGFIECTTQNDTLHARIIDNTRYHHLLHDTVRNVYWAYYNERMLMYDPQTHAAATVTRLLSALGISNVEQLFVVPGSGCLLLKDPGRLLLIDPQKGTMISLFKNYNLKDAHMSFNNGRIVLAGKFGVLMSRIQDVINHRGPLVFQNIRNEHYLQVLDMAVMKDKLLLKTDKCTYLSDLPANITFDTAHPPANQHKVVIEYRDTLYNIPGLQKLNIYNSDKLLIDVISPIGNGILKYKYRIQETDNLWHELNGNELKLPSLVPGSAYHLYIMASDDVWQSDELPVLLYMVPEWWQTRGWMIAIFICIVLLVALVLLFIVLLTRYFVKKAAHRKQLLNTLELRAIHAQINPHFIFNTLNTALYFIKKEKNEEAATHVSRFARLLRGYLESSHRRYTSIAEEITSIGNYIELQKTRFEDVFTYEIIVNDHLDTTNTYIPSLLLQPLVENAINHGLAPKGRDGHLYIIFQRGDNGTGITCIIDDDGIGRRQAAAFQKDTMLRKESHGSRLTEELVDLFNRYEKMGIHIIYTDKELPETGTRVTIQINQPRYER